MKSTRLKLAGKRFGRLVVQEYSHTNKYRNAIWKCLCDCGTITFLRSAVLINGHTQSCGCLQKEMILERNYKHGFSKTKLYQVWGDMKKRCFDKNRKQFKDWGGRGITICHEWMKFKVFAKWALSNGYHENLTIERIDNDEGYYPENCTFIPFSKQSRNRRNVHLIMYKGESRTIASWARKIGIPYETLRDRYHRGWPIEEMLNTPKLPGPRTWNRSKNIIYAT